MLSGVSPGFDSHSHLHFSHFDEDLEQVLERAHRSGITHIMVPSTDLETSLVSLRIAGNTGCYAACAFHPEHLPAGEGGDHWRRMKALFVEPGAVAVGETGLDSHHGTFPHGVQEEWFNRHITLARALGYPLIVHSREAESRVLDTLPEDPGIPVILHCWSGNGEETDRAVKRGFYIGAGGPLTYRRNNGLRSVIATVPEELLLAETDAPFLPPEPHRGKRNEPGYTRYVVRAIRELHGSNRSIEGTSFKLWENAMRAFLLHPDCRRAEIAYRYGDSVYLNITSRCCNSCRFCVRREADGIAGHFLHHSTDPSEELVESTVDALPLEDFDETVFCGFGEPTLRGGLVVNIAEKLKKRGIKTRLDTNGLCCSFMPRESVMRMIRSVDSINVSLNASGAVRYRTICRPSVDNAWDHLMQFLRLVRKAERPVTVSAVKGSGADMERVSRLADRLGLVLRVRG